MKYGLFVLLLILLVLEACVKEEVQCWDGSFANTRSACPKVPSVEQVTAPQKIEKVQSSPFDETPYLKGAMDIFSSSKEMLGIPELHPSNIFFSSDVSGRLTKRYRVGLENRVWLDIAEFNETIKANESELFIKIKEVYWDIQQKYPNLKIRNAFRNPDTYNLIASNEHNIFDVESTSSNEYELTNFTIELFEIYPGKDEHGNPMPDLLFLDRYYIHQRVLFCPPSLLISLDRGIDSYYQTADFEMTASVEDLVPGERNMANSKVKADRETTEKLMDRIRSACNSAIPRLGHIDYTLTEGTLLKEFKPPDIQSLKTTYYNKTRAENRNVAPTLFLDSATLPEKTQTVRVSSINKTTILFFNGTSPCSVITDVIVNEGGTNGTTGFALKPVGSNKHIVATYESNGFIRNTPVGYEDATTFTQIGSGRLDNEFTQQIMFKGRSLVIILNNLRRYEGDYRLVRGWEPLEVGLVVKNADITFEGLRYECYG